MKTGARLLANPCLWTLFCTKMKVVSEKQEDAPL